MHRIEVTAVAGERIGLASTRRRVSEALETTDMAINHYRVAPGDELPGGLHTHMDQEEVFLVLEGTATFETLEAPVEVSAGEAVRFSPGEFQSGRNQADRDLVVVAIGAPPDPKDTRVPLDCPACGTEAVRLDTDGAVTFVCPDCENESMPAPCPACGGEDLRATAAAAAEPVVGCRDCGATYDTPPLTNED